MNLKVIGAGFGRTGTLSLKHALEALGFDPCYHMAEVGAHPEHVPHWLAATRGEAVDWTQIFTGFQATVDWPGCTFWRELLALNPDAKVLLSSRDPVGWHKSVMNTIYHAMTTRIPDGAPETLRAFQDFSREHVIDREFGGRITEQEHALAVYERHYETVRREVPSGQLIEYEVGSGWEPLCAGLGVPIPDMPYPNMNSTEEYQSRLAEARAARKAK